MHMQDPQSCGDGRDIVVVLPRHNSIQINLDAIDPLVFGSRLHQIYRNRVERVVFLKADSNLEFQEVVSVIDRAQNAVPGLRIGLITPSVEGEPCLAIPLRREPLPLPER